MLGGVHILYKYGEITLSDVTITFTNMDYLTLAKAEPLPNVVYYVNNYECQPVNSS